MGQVPYYRVAENDKTIRPAEGEEAYDPLMPFEKKRRVGENNGPETAKDDDDLGEHLTAMYWG